MSSSTCTNLYQDLSKVKLQPNSTIKFSSTAPFVPEFVKANVTNNPEEIYKNRVLGRQILLENPARESRAKREAKAKSERRKKAKERAKLGTVGRRVRKEKALWELDPAQRRYELFIPLHQLWMGYMSELLGLPTKGSTPVASSSMHPKLVKADFHGSILTVKQAKNPALIGLQGIVIHETENAFKIITKLNTQKMVPKQNVIFTFPVPLNAVPGTRTGEQVTSTALDQPHMLFTLYGNQFRFRSAERAGRKFKHRVTIEL